MSTDKLEIKTNNHWHDFIYGYELTPEELSEFDYIDDPDMSTFFRYRGRVYSVQEFMRIGYPFCVMPEEHPFRQWDGYAGDSFFSGVLIRYSADGEQYQVATYLS